MKRSVRILWLAPLALQQLQQLQQQLQLPRSFAVWRNVARASGAPAESAAESAESEDFAEVLKIFERAGLSDRVNDVLQWCEEQGASSSEEVFENLEDLGEELGLSDLRPLRELRAMQRELHAVCAEGRVERLAEIVSKVDLEAEATEDTEGASRAGARPVHLAAQRGHTETLRLLLQNGANVNARDGDGRMALHLAAFQGHTEALELLLDSGAVVNAVERGQASAALHGAARGGHAAAAASLLRHGAERDLRDAMGRDALHWACFWGQKSTAELLIAEGANFGEENRDTGSGAGVMHWAAWRGHKELLAFLIEQKADPNARSLQRNTPLHFAAEAGHLEIVKDLLKYGSDPNALTDMGESPLTLAQARMTNGHSAPNMAQPECGNHTEVALFLEGLETDREGIHISSDQVALKM